MPLWVKGKFMSDTELTAYIARLTQERDLYRQELIETLRKASVCAAGEKDDCDVCDYGQHKQCPSKLSPYYAKVRLEQLLGVSNIC